MTCEDELAFLPLIIHAFVEHAGHDTIVNRFTHVLVEQQRSVQCIDTDAVSTANHNLSRYIIYPGTLG
jgi:hypothetical protein